MSTTVDNRVVKLVFDNEEFEETVRDTIDLLKEFEESLDMDDAASGFDALEDAAEKLDISDVGEKANKEAGNVEKAASEASGHISKIDSAASKLDFTAIGAGMTAEESKVANSSSTMAGDIDKIDASAGKVSFASIGAAADSVADRVENALSGIGSVIDSLGKKISDLNFAGIGKGMEDEANRVTDAASNAANNIDKIDDVVGNLDFTSIGSGVENESSRIADASGEAAGSIDRIDDAASDADFSPLGKSAWNATNEINDAASGVSLQPIVDEIQTASNEFDALGTIVGGMLFGLGGQIEEFAVGKLRGLKDAIVTPIKEGFGEYETQIGSIQTILANTDRDFDSDKDIGEVNDALFALNKYADDTIYKFTDMTQAIGSFTAAGLDLEEATRAVQGLANMAALSGAGMSEYHGILPQVAQALTAGTVQLQDWKSFMNRGMGGQKIVDFFANMAEHMAGAGLIGANEDEQAGIIETAKLLQSHDLTMKQSMTKNESPFYTWFDSSVLSEALMAYTFDTDDPEEKSKMEEHLKQLGYAENELNDIFKLAELARRSATEVRTLSQLIDTTGEAIGSNWTTVWTNFVGDFKEATNTFTFLSQVFSAGVDGLLGPIVNLSKAFDESGAGKILWGDMLIAQNAEGEYAKVWDEELNRWTRVEGALDHLVEAIGKPLDAIGAGLADAFHVDGEQLGTFLVGMCQSFEQFTQSLVISDDAALGLYEGAKGVGAALQVVGQIIADIIGVFFAVADAARVFVDPLIDIGAALGGLVGKLLVAFADEFFEIRNAVIIAIQPLISIGEAIGNIVTAFFDWADIPGIINNVGTFLAELVHVFFDFLDIPRKIHVFAEFIGDITGWNAAMDEAAKQTQETGEKVSIFDIWLQNLMKNPVIKFFADLASVIGDKVGGAIEGIHKFFEGDFFDKEVFDEETGEKVYTKIGRIHEVIKPFVEALNNFKPKVTEFFGALGNGIKTVIDIAGGFATGIGGLLSGIGDLIGKLGEMFLAWGPIQDLTEKLTAFKDGAIQWFLDLPNKIGGAASEMPGHLESIKANLGGVFDWFNTTAEYFKNVSGEQFIQDVKNMFLGMVESIKTSFENLQNLNPQTIVDGIVNFIRSIPARVTAAFEGLKGILDDNQESVLNGFIVNMFKFDPEKAVTLDDSFKFIREMLNAKLVEIIHWWQGIAAESNTIPEFIANLFIEIGAIISNKIDEIKNFFANITPQSIVDAITTKIQEVITGVGQFITEQLGKIGEWIKPGSGTELQTAFITNIQAPIQNAFNGVKQWLNEAAAKSQTIPGFIANLFAGAKERLEAKIGELTQGFQGLNFVETVDKVVGDTGTWIDTKFGPFFDTVGSVFDARFPELSGKVDTGMGNIKGSITGNAHEIAGEVQDSLDKTDSIPEFIGSIFGKIVNKVKEGIGNVVKMISEFQPEDLWTALRDFTGKISEKIKEMFPDLAPFTTEALAKIWLFFNKLKDNSGTWGELASNVWKVLKTHIDHWLDIIFDGFDALSTFLQEKVEGVCGTLSGLPGPLGELFKSIGDNLDDTEWKAGTAVRTLPDKFGKIFGGIKGPVDTALGHLGRFWAGLKIENIPEGAMDILGKIKDWIGDKLQSVADYIKDVPSKVNKILDDLKKSPEKIGEVIESVKKVLNKDTFDWAADIVERVIYLKTMISTNRLLDNTSNFIKRVNGLLKSRELKNITEGYKTVGEVILMIAGALWLISTIPDPQKCVNIMLEVVALMEVMEYLPGILKKIGLEGGGGKALKDMAESLAIFCGGLLAVMYVVEKLTAFDWAANTNGLIAMGVCFGALIFAAILMTRFAGNGGENLEKAAKSLLWMSVAAGIIAYVVTKCSQEVNPDGAKVVGVVIGLTIAAFWALIKFTQGMDAAATAQALFKFSEGVAIIAACIWVLSDCDPAAVAVGAGAIDSMLAAFFVIVKFTESNDLMAAAKAIDVFSVGVGVMAYALYQLADKDWSNMVGAAAAIDIILAGLALVAIFTEDHDLMQAAKAIDVFSLGVGVMAYALYQLADKDWGKMMGAAAAIDVLLLGLVAVTDWTKGTDIVSTAAAIDLFSLAVGVLALSLLTLADKDWAGLFTAAAAIDVVLLGLVGVTDLTKGTDLVATAGAIDMFALAVAAIALSLSQLAQVDATGLGKAVEALNWILIPFEALVGILSIPVLAQGASTVLPGLALAFAALGAAVFGIGEGLNAAMDALQKLVIMGPMLLLFVETIAPHIWEFAEAAIGLTALGAALVVFGAGLLTFGAGATVAGAGLTLISVGIREFLELLRDLPDLLTGAGEGIGTLFASIPEAISNGWNGVTTWWSETALPALQEWFGGIFETVGGWFSGIGEWFTNTAIPAITGLWGQVTEWWNTTVLPAIGPAFETIKNTVGEWFGNVSTWFTETGWPMIQNAFGNFWKWLTETAIPKVAEWGTAAGEKISEVFGNFCKWFTETGWPMIKENAGKFWIWLTETGLPKLLEISGKAIGFLGEVIGKIGKWVVEEGFPMVGKMIGDFLNWFFKDGIPMLGKLLTDLVTWLGGVFKDIGSWILTDGIPAVGKMLGDIAGEIGKWLEGLPGMLVDGISKIWDGIVDAGKNIVSGIMEGITNFDADAVWKGICEMGNGIVDAAKNFFGINSPSKLMRDTIGLGIPEGIAVGIEKYSGVAEAAAEDLAEDTADSANKALSVMGSDYEGSLSMSANVTPVMNPDTLNKGLFDIQGQLDRMFNGMNYNYTTAQEINIQGIETLRQDINKNFTELRETMLKTTTDITNWIASEGERIDERLIDIEENHLERMDVVLDSGELVGALTPAIDQSLGQRQEYTSRGVY